MGACAGKKQKPKQSTSNQPKTDSAKQTELSTKDNNLQPNSSSTLPQNSSITNGSTVNPDDVNRTPSVKDDDITPGIQVIIDKQNKINDVITKPLLSRVVSTTDTELELELAKLVYGNPEKDYAENPPASTTFKSTEV